MTALVLTPVVEPEPTGPLVPVDQLTDQALLTLVRARLDWAEADLSTDPDEIPMLEGGYVLTGPEGLILEPGCCSDLGDLDPWASAASSPDAEWAMLYNGHPWIAVRSRDGWLELSEPTDADLPLPDGATLAVAARLRAADLQPAVAAASAARTRFGDRITALLSTEAAQAGVDLGPVVQALLGRP